MKMLSKEHLAGKIDYILNEKQIMIDFQHPFLLKLH
jgi:hypothetical protein